LAEVEQGVEDALGDAARLTRRRPQDEPEIAGVFDVRQRDVQGGVQAVYVDGDGKSGALRALDAERGDCGVTHAGSGGNARVAVGAEDDEARARADHRWKPSRRDAA